MEKYIRGGQYPELTEIDGIRCAKFGTAHLRLQDITLIKDLKVWTVQVWIYPTVVTTIPNEQYFILTNYPLGQSGSSTNVVIEIYGSSLIVAPSGYTAAITANDWYSLKLTSDGTNAYFYLNNTLMSTGTLGSCGFANGLTIGDEQGNFGWVTQFNGYMTQFKLSDKFNANTLPLENKYLYIAQDGSVWGNVI